MNTEVDSFYGEILGRLIKEGVMAPDSRLLVCCGGDYDHKMMLDCGFTNVVISNLDERIEQGRFAPYDWSFQDTEKLTFADGSFDFVTVHSGLHHCHSPHQAMLEMYRVARKGVLLFEPYDNLVTRLGVALGIGQDFERASVFHNGLKCGRGAQHRNPKLHLPVDAARDYQGHHLQCTLRAARVPFLSSPPCS